MSEPKRFVAVFWSCTPMGWIEVHRGIMAETKAEAKKKALAKEDENPGMVTFVGWEDEINEEE